MNDISITSFSECCLRYHLSPTNFLNISRIHCDSILPLIFVGHVLNIGNLKYFFTFMYATASI